MDISSLKEYTRLNLQRTGLHLSEEDRKTARSMDSAMKAIGTADQLGDSFAREMKEKRFERFCYGNMSLSYWTLVVCMSMLALLLDEYLKTGELLVAFDYTWMLYILPAIFLTVRLFLFSFVNIGHLVLLVLCAVLTILKIRIFGSEVNWMWVFIALGTVLTLGGRVWEWAHRMRANSQWYQSNMKILTDAESAIPKAAAAYRAMGQKADAQMKQRFPGFKATSRAPWFEFSRKPDRKGSISFPHAPQANSNFTTKITDRQERISTPTESGTREITVFNQRMGWESISRDTALSYIRSGKMVPFYGMEVPEHLPELHYSIYTHSWSERIYEQGNHRHTSYSKRYTGARTKAAGAYDDLESKHLGTTAEVFSAKTHSTEAWAESQKYLDQKNRDLNSLSDYDVDEHRYTTPFQRESEKQYLELGAMTVTTPDGELVGLYCGSTGEAISFAGRIAQSKWHAALSPWATPVGEAQTAVLHQEYLM